MLESLKKRKASSDDTNGCRDMAMTVGRYLKTERELQGQDLQQVAEMLRIQHSYLQAIEEGEIDQLPGPTYAVGFVRAYAEYLGLEGTRLPNASRKRVRFPKTCAVDFTIAPAGRTNSQSCRIADRSSPTLGHLRRLGVRIFP